MGKIKIHLIDDHQIVIDGLLAVLKMEDDFEVVGFSLNGDGIHERLTANNADVVIMDINMPDIDGIDILKDFQKKGIPCKIIVLSSHDEIKLIKEVLNLGANGYLSKKCAGENIAVAVRKVYNGEQYFCDAVKDKMLTSFSSNGATDNEPVKNITKRELEILQLVVKEFTTKEISEQLTISINTIDTHRKNIMCKLEVKNTIGLVKYAIKHDLV